jgi:hypothetical protein
VYRPGGAGGREWALRSWWRAYTRCELISPTAVESIVELRDTHPAIVALSIGFPCDGCGGKKGAGATLADLPPPPPSAFSGELPGAPAGNSVLMMLMQILATDPERAAGLIAAMQAEADAAATEDTE